MDYMDYLELMESMLNQILDDYELSSKDFSQAIVIIAEELLSDLDQLPKSASSAVAYLAAEAIPDPNQTKDIITIIAQIAASLSSQPVVELEPVCDCLQEPLPDYPVEKRERFYTFDRIMGILGILLSLYVIVDTKISNASADIAQQEQIALELRQTEALEKIADHIGHISCTLNDVGQDINSLRKQIEKLLDSADSPSQHECSDAGAEDGYALENGTGS